MYEEASRSAAMAIGNAEYGVELSGYGVRRLPVWLTDGLSSLLLALVPQLEGSPALQSLFMSLFLIASGTASSLLNTMLRTAIGRD
jgi:hypothetical protein